MKAPCFALVYDMLCTDWSSHTVNLFHTVRCLAHRRCGAPFPRSFGITVPGNAVVDSLDATCAQRHGITATTPMFSPHNLEWLGYSVEASKRNLVLVTNHFHENVHYAGIPSILFSSNRWHLSLLCRSGPDGLARSYSARYSLQLSRFLYPGP